MNQVVTITGVETKSGNTEKGGWTLYKFSTAGGSNFQTFDDELGEKIKGLIGQATEVEYEVQSKDLPAKGDRPATTVHNNVIKSAKEANGNGSTDAVVRQELNNVNTARNFEEERQLRIMRQSALDRAINTVAAGIGGLVPAEVPVSDLFTLADGYINYFENGAA